MVILMPGSIPCSSDLRGLYPASSFAMSRESVLAHWKVERQAADADAKAAAEAAACRHEDELRAAKAEISALRQTAAERCEIIQLSLVHYLVQSRITSLSLLKCDMDSYGCRKPADEKRHAEMLAAIERWRVLVSEKEEEVRGLQQQMGHLQSQVRLPAHC